MPQQTTQLLSNLTAYRFEADSKGDIKINEPVTIEAGTLCEILEVEAVVDIDRAPQQCSFVGVERCLYAVPSRDLLYATIGRNKPPTNWD